MVTHAQEFIEASLVFFVNDSFVRSFVYNQPGHNPNNVILTLKKITIIIITFDDKATTVYIFLCCCQFRLPNNISPKREREKFIKKNVFFFFDIRFVIVII